jgi:hypothetical protein
MFSRRIGRQLFHVAALVQRAFDLGELFQRLRLVDDDGGTRANNVAILAEDLERTAERLWHGGDACRHIGVGIFFAMNGTLAVFAQSEEEFGGARHNRAKRKVLVLREQLARSFSENAEQPQAHHRITLDEGLKVFKRDVPRDTVLDSNGGGEVGSPIEDSDFVEHDDRLDLCHNRLLTLGSHFAQMNMSLKEDEHPGGGFTFAKDDAPGGMRAHLTGVDDFGAVGFGESLEMFYATQGFNEVGGKRVVIVS